MRKLLFLIAFAVVLTVGCATAERMANRDIDIALSEAIAGGDLERAESLLDEGAKINTQFRLSGGHTVLTMVAGVNDASIVKFLLEHGADPNLGTNKGRTPLMQASMGGQLENVMLLLEHGAAPNSREDNGNTALELAAKNGHDEVVEALKRGGAES